MPTPGLFSRCRGFKDDPFAGPRLAGGHNCPEAMKAKRLQRRFKMGEAIAHGCLMMQSLFSFIALFAYGRDYHSDASSGAKRLRRSSSVN